MNVIDIKQSEGRFSGEHSNGRFTSATGNGTYSHPNETQPINISALKIGDANKLLGTDSESYLLSPDDLKSTLRRCIELSDMIFFQGYRNINIRDIQRAEMDIREAQHWCYEENLALKFDNIGKRLAMQKYNKVLYDTISSAKVMLAQGNTWNTPTAVYRMTEKISEAMSPAKSQVLINEAILVNKNLEHLLLSYD